MASGLVKRYGDLLAVDGVDLRVERGDVYGFLGPNGAGKTTLIRMLLGLIRPSEGHARLFGRDPALDTVAALHGVAGFVEAPAFYGYLSGRANLELLAGLDGLGAAQPPIEEVLEAVGLRGREGDRVRGYSHGMKQRLGVAATVLRDPRLVVLVEPTTGLDPPAMRDMRALVRRLTSEGRTVFLSTHLMNEVEELCNRVAVVRRGRIVFEGPLAALLAEASPGRVRLRASDPARAREVIERVPGLSALPGSNGELLLTGSEDALDRFTVALGHEGVAIRALEPERASLEDAFFRLTEDAPPS